MSKKRNNGRSWKQCLLISVGTFAALLIFYRPYLPRISSSINVWTGIILYLSSLFISLVVQYYCIILVCSMDISHDFNKTKIKWGILLIIEILAVIPIIFVDHLILMLQITFMLIALLAIVFLALTKFFYMETKCWWRQVLINSEEILCYSNKIMSWNIIIIILSIFLIFIIGTFSRYSFLICIIENKVLFKWSFNLFLFTFFSLIISILGNLFVERKANTEDSEFLFYMLNIKVLVIWFILLFFAYAFMGVFPLDKKSLSLTSVFLISSFYTFFVILFYYFIKKFFNTISFIRSSKGIRIDIKRTILFLSLLNKNTLRLWNVFWGNEQFGDALSESVFLSDFVPKIVYHKKFFQLKDQVSVAADALRGFSDNIDKRHSEALAREVLNIVPRQYIQPKRLPEYLVDVLNAYKDIVCYDKLVCEEPDFEISFYKGFFKSEANEFLPKYQYIDELIYQILVTLRKSIEKLRNDKYFEKYDESRKILCEKFNKFIDTLAGLKCKDDGKGKLEETLKTESAKKWIKEVGNLLEKVVDNNKDININNNRATLTFNFTKAVQALKNGNIDTNALKKVLEKWTEICKQDSTKQDNPEQS